MRITDKIYGSLSRDYPEVKELHLDEKGKIGEESLKTDGDKLLFIEV